MKSPLKFSILCTTAAVFVSGCSVGPKYKRPDDIIDLSGQYTRTAAVSIDANSISDNYRWWENFADDTTNQLIEKALANNYQIKAAAAKILQAEAIMQQATGQTMPQINYSLNRTRAKTIVLNRQNIATSYYHGVSASYVLDVFAKLKHMKKAAWQNYLASKAAQKAVIHSLIASVIKARVKIATVQKQLDIARDSVKIAGENLKIITRRYNNARASLTDVVMAKEKTAAAKAQIPSLKTALAAATQSLQVLLAEKPDANKVLPETMPPLTSLKPLPGMLEASLLDARPDIEAAEMALKAQNHNVAVSIAQLYPDFTLTGNYGFASEKFNNLLNNNFEIYSLILKAASPIWQGGRLRANVKLQKARFKELACKYADTVIKAFKEVQYGLINEENLQKKYEYLKIKLQYAAKTEKLTFENYTSGLEPLTTFLQAQQQRIAAENEITITTASLWSNRVDLFLALGGNWLNDSLKTDKKYKGSK